jgi:hypothetical protein
MSRRSIAFDTRLVETLADGTLSAILVKGQHICCFVADPGRVPLVAKVISAHRDGPVIVVEKRNGPMITLYMKDLVKTHFRLPAYLADKIRREWLGTDRFLPNAQRIRRELLQAFENEENGLEPQTTAPAAPSPSPSAPGMPDPTLETLAPVVADLWNENKALRAENTELKTKLADVNEAYGILLARLQAPVEISIGSVTAPIVEPRTTNGRPTL